MARVGNIMHQHDSKIKTIEPHDASMHDNPRTGQQFGVGLLFSFAESVESCCGKAAAPTAGFTGAGEWRDRGGLEVLQYYKIHFGTIPYYKVPDRWS